MSRWFQWLFFRPREYRVTLAWLSEEAWYQLSQSPLGASYRGIIFRVDGEDSWQRVCGGSDYPQDLRVLEITIGRDEIAAVERSVLVAQWLVGAKLFRTLNYELAAANEKPA